MNQHIQSASNKGELPFLFTYILMLVSAITILIILLNVRFPSYKFEDELYSCFLNSYEGKIECKFPRDIELMGNGNKISINGKIFPTEDKIKINCRSNTFTIYKGEIKCGTS